MSPLPPGKLKSEFLDKLLKKYTSSAAKNRDLGVIVGPQIGQDSGVVDLGDKYLVMKSDPVTFATDEIGYYAVNINANDIATAGAKPKWFLSVILLPEKNTDEKLVEKIFSDIADSCAKLNIAVIGGHTEITFGIDRPIVIGSMLGEVAKDKLLTTFIAKPGDALIMTKGIVIEGAAIIAHEKEQKLRAKGMSEDTIARFKNMLHNPGISVVKDALALAENFTVHAMHDPTEGGLAMGIVELAQNSNCGLLIEYDKIPFMPGTKALCESFGLDPLRTITSGTLIAAVDNTQVFKIIQYFEKQGILASKIGELTAIKDEFLIKMPNGKIEPLLYSETDEITKIFS